jgi:hypothetical protein
MPPSFRGKRAYPKSEPEFQMRHVVPIGYRANRDPMRSSLDRFFAGFVCSDANCFFDRIDKYLSVTDFSGLGRFYDGRRRVFNHAIGENDFDFDFRKKIDGIFTASVDFSVPFLAPESFDFRYRHPLNAEVR